MLAGIDQPTNGVELSLLAQTNNCMQIKVTALGNRKKLGRDVRCNALNGVRDIGCNALIR